MTELNEAINVLSLTLRDVNDIIKQLNKRFEQTKTREQLLRIYRAEQLLPDLRPVSYTQLKLEIPDFANQVLVYKTFQSNKPKLFGMIKSKTYQHDLEMLRIQLRSFLEIDSPSECDDIQKQLNEYYDHRQQVTKLLTILTNLKGVNGQLNEKLVAQISKIAKFSNNHSVGRRDEYAIADGYYFEEDWNSFMDFATEMFIIYETLSASDALADNIDLIPETFAQPLEQLVESINPSNEQTTEQIYSSSTNDELGYFS